MSKKLKFVLNRSGVSELLKCSSMQGVLSEYAQGVVRRAGDGFEADIYVGKNRANVAVKTSNPKAYFKNKKNNTLLKALK